MRSVFDTLLKPEWVLSATGHSTEWISTNTRLPLPRPNQINASGNNAIAGSGLNIAVTVSADAGGDGEDGENCGQHDAGAVSHEQHLERRPGAKWDRAVAHLVEHRN